MATGQTNDRSHSNGPARRAEQSIDRERLEGSSSKIREGVHELADEARKVASQTGEAAYSKVQEGVGAVASKASTTTRRLEEIIKDEPLKSLGVAVVAGFALGSLLCRRS